MVVKLSDEMMLKFLSYCDQQTLAQYFRVSHHWRAVASDNTLWKQMFPGVPVPEEASHKALGYSYGVKQEDLLQRVQNFVNNIKLEYNNTFTCHFLSNAQAGIHIELMRRNDTSLLELCTTGICKDLLQPKVEEKVEEHVVYLGVCGGNSVMNLQNCSSESKLQRPDSPWYQKEVVHAKCRIDHPFQPCTFDLRQIDPKKLELMEIYDKIVAEVKRAGEQLISSRP